MMITYDVYTFTQKQIKVHSIWCRRRSLRAQAEASMPSILSLYSRYANIGSRQNMTTVVRWLSSSADVMLRLRLSVNPFNRS